MDLLGFIYIIAQAGQVAPQAAAATANAASHTPDINYTVLLTVASVLIAAFATFTKIYGREVKPTELPSESNVYCKQRGKDLDRVEATANSTQKQTTEIKEVIGEMKITIAKLESKMNSTSDTIGEMKMNNKELAQRLENLIGQLVDYMSED